MQVSQDTFSEITKALDRYKDTVEKTELRDSAKRTYLLHAEHFVRWLEVDFEPGARKGKTGPD